MDDRQFDQKTAMEWINTIEDEKSRVREDDLYPHLRVWANRVNPREILDIGCGQGICSEKIELKNCTYTGVDPSTFLLERARHLYKESYKHFIFGSVYSLPFSNGSFDAAFSVAVWHLLEDKQKASSEMGRVLKEGGHFLIVAANPNTYEAWTSIYASSKRDGLKFEGKMRQNDGPETTDTLYLHTYDEIASSLRAARLEVKGTTTFRTAIAIQGQKLQRSILFRKTKNLKPK